MFYTPLIHHAIDFAIQVHETDSKKKRKGKDIPYIVHPLAVALILSRVTQDEEIIVAGLLHDTIEDCEPYGRVTTQTLERKFGHKVAMLVNAVTEQNKSLPWKDRKLTALNHIKDMNHNEVLLKTADILHNLTDLLEDIDVDGLEVFKKFNASQYDAVERYRNLEKKLWLAWKENPLLEELSQAVAKLMYITKHDNG